MSCYAVYDAAHAMRRYAARAAVRCRHDVCAATGALFTRRVYDYFL